MKTRTDKELIDYLEKWGGRIKLWDDVQPIEFQRCEKRVFTKNGIKSKFTFEVGGYGKFWAKKDKNGKKSLRSAGFREALNAAIRYREDMNAKVTLETVLKDLQEYADERHQADEDRLKEDPKEYEGKKWLFGDEKDILAVKALMEAKKFKEAAKAAQHTDTFIRDGFSDNFRRFLIQNRIVE